MSGRPSTRAGRSALVFAALAAFALPAGVEAADDVVEATAIVDRALERAAAQRESGLELDFEYMTAGVFESLDRDGNVTRTQTARRRRYSLEGHLYAEVVERDGKPLDGDDAREERERKAEFIREARRLAARGERYEPEEMSVDFDRRGSSTSSGSNRTCGCLPSLASSSTCACSSASSRSGAASGPSGWSTGRPEYRPRCPDAAASSSTISGFRQRVSRIPRNGGGPAPRAAARGLVRVGRSRSSCHRLLALQCPGTGNPVSRHDDSPLAR